MAIIQGTQGNDSFLNGTVEDDKIYGFAGDDSLYGNQGSDKLYGGKDNDTLDGADGNDTLDGAQGNDTLYGYVGNDILYGGKGNDKLVGWIGNDILYGGAGNDFLDGAFEGSGFGGGENQIDTLIGGAGRDTFKISYLDDIAPSTAGTSDYTLIKDFNPHQDFIQLTGAKTNYSLSTAPNGLPKGTAIFFDKPGTEPDELIALIEEDSGLNLNRSYFTSTVNDIFYGTDGANQFDGGTGDDLLIGYGGNDSFTGGNGNDLLVGGTGNDFLYGGNGDDILKGIEDQGSSEAIRGLGEIDTLAGGRGTDKFILGEVVGYKYGTNIYVYYEDVLTKTAGTTDYALIQDFDSSQDVIQLLGTASEYILSSSSGNLPAGTRIYVDKPNTEPDELIAILQGVSPSSISLSAAYFSYVNG